MVPASTDLVCSTTQNKNYVTTKVNYFHMRPGTQREEERRRPKAADQLTNTPLAEGGAEIAAVGKVVNQIEAYYSSQY